MEEYPHVLRIFYKVEGKKRDGAFDVKVSHSSQLIVNNTEDCSDEISTEKHYSPEDVVAIHAQFAVLPDLAYDSEDREYLQDVNGIRIYGNGSLGEVKSQWIEVYGIQEDFSNSKLVREQVNQRVKEIFDFLEMELEGLE